jgi:glycosyltransferase involved in cell wall biosynthesis
MELSSSSKKSRISIVCCSYNLAPFVETSLDSIFNQDESGLKIIFSDGGSNDATLSLIKKYKDMDVLIGPDGGYLGGFWKALANVKTKYVTQCAISDGYLNREWLREACDFLDSNSNISLVWGIPSVLGKDGKTQILGYDFLNNELPSSSYMYEHWLQTGFHFPEGNLVCRSEVLRNCMPAYSAYQNLITDPFLMFTRNFHTKGYLSYGLNILSNYGRIHDNQLTVREELNGKKYLFLENYYNLIEQELDIIKNKKKTFCDPNGKELFQKRITKQVYIYLLHSLNEKKITNVLNFHPSALSFLKVNYLRLIYRYHRLFTFSLKYLLSKHSKNRFSVLGNEDLFEF